VLIRDFDVDVLLVEALDVAIDLPSLLGLIDGELGAQSTLARLSLTASLALSLALSLKMCLTLGFTVDLTQQLINLAEEVVE
jgi:hypothetical protein